MKDLLIVQPEPLRLIKAVKDAEACTYCGGTRPELFWNGFTMAHDRCARDAKAARKAGPVEPQATMKAEEFMVKLAANEKLIRRLFRVRH